MLYNADMLTERFNVVMRLSFGPLVDYYYAPDRTMLIGGMGRVVGLERMVLGVLRDAQLIGALFANGNSVRKWERKKNRGEKVRKMGKNEGKWKEKSNFCGKNDIF